jgi:L-ascorbate metabolism protein UlaG (beta-lactamase superfamily)
MSIQIQFFGVAGYKIVTADGRHVVIDPFLEGNPYCKTGVDDLERVDLLLLTHNAFDHLGEAPMVIEKYRPKVVCALDVLRNLTVNHGADPDLMRVTIWGMRMEVAGIRVTPVESRHWSFAKNPDGSLLSGPAMGFMLEAGDGQVIYHPGDTALFSDMVLLGKTFRPTIGLMHVSLPAEEGVALPHPECYLSGELTPYEALQASEMLGLREVVTSHYVDPETQDVKDFLRLVSEQQARGAYAPEVTVLSPDETIIR